MKKLLPIIFILTLLFSAKALAADKDIADLARNGFAKTAAGAIKRNAEAASSFVDELDPSVEFISGKAVLYDLDGKKVRDLGVLTSTKAGEGATEHDIVQWEDPQKIPEREGVVKFEVKVKTKVETGSWDNTATVTINSTQKNTNIVNVRATTDKYYEPVKSTSARIDQDDNHYVEPGEAYSYTITQKINKAGVDYEQDHYPGPMVITDALPSDVSFISAEATINGQKVGYINYNADTRTVIWSEKDGDEPSTGNSEIALDGSDLILTIRVSTHEQDELINDSWDNKAYLSIGHEIGSWSNTVTVKAKRTYSVSTLGENVEIDPDVDDIPEGDNVRIAFSAMEGYHITYIEVDGEEIDPAGVEGFYDFNNIRDNHYINVVAEKDTPNDIPLSVIHRAVDTKQILSREELGPFAVGDDYETSAKPNGTFPGYTHVEGDAPAESYPRAGKITEFTYPVIYEYRNTDPDAVTLTIIKVDEEGNPLGGAHFLVDGKTYVTDASDGSVKISLHNGDYTITETQAPEGYYITNPTTNVHVEGDTEITIQNEKTVELPVTGRKGILLGIIAGLVVLGASILYLILRRKEGSK